jgi:hypothetical protein
MTDPLSPAALDPGTVHMYQRADGSIVPAADLEPLAEPPESDTAFTRRQAAMVEAMIAEWEAQGNYDRHLIQARR